MMTAMKEDNVKTLTEHQCDVLESFKMLERIMGYPPSCRELAKELHVSGAAIHETMIVLCAAGEIHKEKRPGGRYTSVKQKGGKAK